MPNFHKGVVFVTDDDEDQRETTQDLLEDAGYLVLTARNGTEALARMRGIGGAALAIIDLLMPGMDGWELIRRMRADGELKRLPVIVLTGQDKAPSEGVAHVLRKPYAPDDLLALVDGLFARQEREPVAPPRGS